MILEPAVTLTDYALAAECGILAVMVSRRPGHGSRVWFALFFASLGFAAMLGGTVHGFLPDETTPGYAVLWRATLLSIGMASLSAAAAALASGWSRAVKPAIAAGCIAAFMVYCAQVLFVRHDFRIAILAYVPASALLLITFVLGYMRAGSAKPERVRLLSGAFGMVLTFIAAGVQQSRFAIGVLDHNAIYHIIQAFALGAIYVGASAIIRVCPVLRS